MARMYAVRLTQKGQAALSAIKPAAARRRPAPAVRARDRQRGGFIEALGEIVRAMSRQASRAALRRPRGVKVTNARSQRFAGAWRCV